MKKFLIFCSSFTALVFFNNSISYAQTVYQLPPCLKNPEPSPISLCTGVVPVDSITGQPLSWQTLFSGLGGGNGPSKVDTVISSNQIDRGLLVGTTAVTLLPTNVNRRGFVIQNQSATANCFINGQDTATADYHSLQIGPGGYFESSSFNVSTSSYSIICNSSSVPIYAREF